MQKDVADEGHEQAGDKPRQGGAACRRILVVDDEAAFLLPLRKLLEGPRLTVDTAETYDAAMACLAAHRYDAVIADIRLSGAMSHEGLMILGHVKGAHQGTKVIMMTGYGSPEVMREAYDLGADYYFEKPVSVSVLSAALAELGVG